MTKFYKNLASALPLAVALGFWLAMADNFRIVTSSARLLGNFGKLSLVLSYGFLTTMVVTIVAASVVSIILSLIDIRGKIQQSRHSGNVLGGVIFILILALIFRYLVANRSLYTVIDPRLAFPIIGSIIFGLLLWRLIVAFAEKYYKPLNWESIIINHYSMSAGTSVFLFGTSAALFGTLAGRVHPRATIDLTAENIIYYMVFLISGIIAWLLIRYILSRLSRLPSIPIALIILIAILPLIMFLRPAKPDNPDKHNPNPSKAGRNLLFISIDTLRYDRLGCDFNNTVQTPNIDALAKDGVVFENCIVPMPVTIPSHYSMFTGLTPRHHGIRVQASPINPDLPTITKTLSHAGLTCGGFVSMSLLSGPNSGLDNGSQYYDDHWLGAGESHFFPPEVKYFIAGKIINIIFTGRSSTPNRYERKAEKTIDSVLKWLDAVHEDDFFCFVHLFDPHWDYNAPEPYKVMYDPYYKGDLKYHFYINKDILANKLRITQRDFKYIVSRYDSEVTYTDYQLGRLFNRLKELGLWDETMIILTADHGESFEHGYIFNHSSRVYQSTIHVPLIIKPFNSSNIGRAGQLCSTTDLYPTICDAFGLATPQGLDGVSLTPLLNDEAGADFLPHEFLFSEAYPFSIPQSIGRIYTIIKGTDKLVYSPYAYPFEPTYQFYDIAIDAGEEHNAYDPADGVCAELTKLLDKWAIADESVANPLMERSEIENLKSLQYLN